MSVVEVSNVFRIHTMREKDIFYFLLHFSLFAPLYYIISVAAFDSPIQQSVREAMMAGIFYAVAMSALQSRISGGSGK